MTKIKLTPRAIDRLRGDGKARRSVRFIDDRASGLLIRVGKTGGKNWGFWKRVPNSREIFRDTFGKVVVLANGKTDPMNVEDAVEWATLLRKAVLAGTNLKHAKLIARGEPTIEELWDKYYNNHALIKKSVGSQEADEGIWRNHIQPEFGMHKVKDVDRPMVEDFYSAKLSELIQKYGRSGGMANNILSLLSKMMSVAMNLSYRANNPCVGVERHRKQHEWPILRDFERNAVMNAADEESGDVGLIIAIAFKTGARKKEILNFRWNELHENVWHIPDPKGRPSRKVNIPPVLLEGLKRWKETSQRSATFAYGWVFPSPVKDGAPRQDIKSVWKRIREKAKLSHLRIHDMRHDFGTQSAVEGMDVFSLMQAMGHSSIETTMKYVNLAAEMRGSDVMASREASIEAARRIKTKAIETLHPTA